MTLEDYPQQGSTPPRLRSGFIPTKVERQSSSGGEMTINSVQRIIEVEMTFGDHTHKGLRSTPPRLRSGIIPKKVERRSSSGVEMTINSVLKDHRAEPR